MQLLYAKNSGKQRNNSGRSAVISFAVSSAAQDFRRESDAAADNLLEEQQKQQDPVLPGRPVYTLRR